QGARLAARARLRVASVLGVASTSPIAVVSGSNLIATLRETLASREVLVELVKRDLKVRYKRSSLGLLWTMLNPLLMMSVTTIAFSQFFRFAIHNFPIYMMTAYVIWGFFSQGTISASSSVHGGAALAK